MPKIIELLFFNNIYYKIDVVLILYWNKKVNQITIYKTEIKNELISGNGIGT